MEKTQQEVWNAIAPEWHVYKQIPSQLSKEFLSKQKGNILDFGSGSGRHLTKITKGKMYLLDFSEKMIELAKKRAKQKRISADFEVTDMKKTPYENNFFDAAISISAIHSTPKKDHKKIVEELYRILKPKSQALIGVWNQHSKRFKRAKGKKIQIGWTTKGKREYYLFDEKEIHNLFKKEGFKIISSHNSEMMLNFIVEK
jgi:ubiquinone/menaquinone biosynthesis C-methylase UbiE